MVVAGPPRSGKSTHFPVDRFGCDSFNVDLRAAAHNGGSARAIPPAVRLRAQRECEAFVEDHIARRESFAVESTRSTTIAIEQARRARKDGFAAQMIFVTAGGPDECVRRIRVRGLAGGHAAPEAEIRDIYARSMTNLLLALDVFDRIELHENAVRGAAPRFVGSVVAGRLIAQHEPLPAWVPDRLR
jgi:predicted ABC-type ATPase